MLGETRETGPDSQQLPDVFDRNCPSRTVMEHVVGKWSVLSLSALRQRPMRFNALRRRVTGVSEKMLAQTLHNLERDGFVRREVLTSIPPHVEYSLTPLGQRVAATVLDLVGLLESTLDETTTAQEAYDNRAA